jgi:RHS repeat-associated protein
MRSVGALVETFIKALICCAMALGLVPAVALAAEPPGGGSLGSLVVPGVQVLDGGQQALSAEEARRASPEALAARERSRTSYESLSAAAAAKLARAVFPGVIDDPAGGPPQLSAGQRIVGYLADNVARVDLGHGKRGVIESTGPLALETSPGHREAIDLDLQEADGAFQPARAGLGLRIPKRLADGVQLTGMGVSLTPVDAAGSPLGGSEGTVDGATVLYANTQTNADTVVKPLLAGFAEDTILRSIASPEQLSYRVGLPRAASLVQAPGGSRALRVVAHGRTIAVITQPTAVDAAGTAVPVHLSVSGDILDISVDDRSGAYQFPIEVDPQVEDKELLPPQPHGNWVSESTSKVIVASGEKNRLYIAHPNIYTESYEEGQTAFWEYPTQGKSHIYDFHAKMGGGAASGIAVGLRVASPGKGREGPEVPVTGGGTTEYNACPASCTPEAVTEENKHNSAYFEVSTLEKGNINFEDDLVVGTSIFIEQEAGPSVTGFDTTDEVVNGEQNPLYGNRWASGTSGKWALKATATDPGTGISKETWSSPNAPKWGGSAQAAGCEGVQCEETASVGTVLREKGTEALPEGEDTVEVKVEDAVGLAATHSTKVKVADAPPHITLSGLPSTNEISDGQHFLLKASGTSGPAGMASVAFTIDGQAVGTPAKGCSTEDCTVTAEWTINSESYAAGKHTIGVTATDNAGNVAKEEYTVTFHHAKSIAVGPASVNPITGELGLSATDVSVSAPGATLTVGRSYLSRHLTAGAEGPLGPQWSMSLGGQESLSRVNGGNMVLTSASGAQSVFTGNGKSEGKGVYTAPPGDAALSLKEKIVGGATDFFLSEDGAVTTFTVPTGGSGSVWEPSISEGAGGNNAVTFAYATLVGVTEPTEELAPVPAGVSCSPTLNKGCRALTFTYAEKTSATIGEGRSQWGEYKGRLKEVAYTAYEPSSKAMKTKVIAEYIYDSKGRLRAEWDPQISPGLRTSYGYDNEGHVTALAPPGQQPWLFEQGTTPTDVGTGRVLALARPAATAVAEQEASAPANTEAPTLSSTTPTVGVKISVNLNSENTPGPWIHNPLAFTYQWMDCNSSGNSCTVIPGAVNRSYYPVKADEGHTLTAEVVALNAAGASGSIRVVPTSVVAAGTPNTPLPEPPSVGSLSVWTLDYQAPLSGTGVPQMGATEVAKWAQTDVPAEATAVFPPDEPMGWPAKEYKRATIFYFDNRDRGVDVSSPTGGISTTEYNSFNDVVRTLSADNRATALSAGGTSAEVSKELDDESTYNETGGEPGTELLSTLGPTHVIELASGGTKTEAREHTVYSYNEGAPKEGGPYHLPTKETEAAEVAGKEEASTVRTTVTSYSGQKELGWKLRKPTSVTVNPAGLKLTHTVLYEPATGGVTETRMPAALAEEQGYAFHFEFGKVGAGKSEFKEPTAIAVNAVGDEYVLDTGNDRVEEFNNKGEFVKEFGCKGCGNEGLKEPKGIALDSSGNVWVADTGGGCIKEFNATGTYIKAICGSGEFNAPQGVAVEANGNLWVANTGDDNVLEYYCENGEYPNGPWKYGKKGSGAEEFDEPQNIAIGAEGNVYITDTGNNRVEEYSKGKYVRTFGKEGKLTGQLKAPHGIATDSTGDVWVADAGNDRIEEFSATGTYLSTFGKEGTKEGKEGTKEGYLSDPQGVAIDPEGNAWVADTGNNRVEEWKNSGGSYGAGVPSAHDSQTIYYTAGVNVHVTACGEHPEWANLPCQTQPAAQPVGGLPQLQITSYTYNIWDEPEVTTSTSGTTTRTTTDTYDAAGRLKTTAIKSTVGVALPTVTDKYNELLGALEEQSTTSAGKTVTVASHYNTLGEVTSYVDASESTTTYEYDVDGRVKKVNDGKGTETYSYGEATGLPTELVNEYGTTRLAFTAKYDVEGNVLMEGYPNGMNANYTYNAVGAPTSLEYVKTTHCTTNCTWFSDTVVPSVHGQWLEQTSTLSHQGYTYDADGRLTEVQNTPTGQGCTTRVYTYDTDTNRTNLASAAPGGGGKCTTEGATTEKHTYDEADRLNDAGVTYNAFGDITALPAADAGGKEVSEGLTSEYYVDNQLATQKQGGQTIGYNLDPVGRTLETVATGNRAETVTNHYSGPGEAPAWTSNTGGETVRDIAGIAGGLVATQSALSEPVLQLANLHGDIIATAYLSETATGLASKADTSEYGVPTTSLPPKYSWLGAADIPTELPSGVLNMGARSYVPQLGRFLQPDPVAGGSADAYSYTFGDPVNTADPSGEYTATIEGWSREESGGIAATLAVAYAAEIAVERAAQLAAEEAIARAEAEAAAYEAATAAYWAAGPQYAEEEEEWEEGEEEYEYASYGQGAKPEGEGAQVESATLYQPLVAGGADATFDKEAAPDSRENVEENKPGSGGRRHRRHPECREHDDTPSPTAGPGPTEQDREGYEHLTGKKSTPAAEKVATEVIQELASKAKEILEKCLDDE